MQPDAMRATRPAAAPMQAVCALPQRSAVPYGVAWQHAPGGGAAGPFLAGWAGHLRAGGLCRWQP